MHLAELIDKIARISYPFLTAFVAWYLRRYTKNSQNKLDQIQNTTVSTEQRMNGRLDELIAAREQLAYERGRKDAIGDMLTGKLDKS